jgi:hypothetical protein
MVEQVYAPMVELLTALEPEFGPGRIFGPYRDIRFSPDKSPYKIHLGAWLESGGYLRLSAEGLAAGCGCGEDIRRKWHAVPLPVRSARWRSGCDRVYAGGRFDSAAPLIRSGRRGGSSCPEHDG